ncbi:class I SAM-dependent DNA methyltransferase [Halovivax gelatinilyticus]|uniref:class I SAM-dependent DNA methyltransferase n=1 Tax=Halovivax gelatinilyticus TaxID=2961597 RepID=UPI0020CA8BEC|nr:class I SAM-dependent methyltransferase [Halovivax gelatinilyticus]
MEDDDSRVDSYRLERARFYDRQLAGIDRPDVDYYRRLANDVDGSVLEIACGTGRVYLELLAAGVDVDGFDLSADALSVLRENAAERDLEPSVWTADATDFETDRRYDLAICPFNAVQNLPTIDDQLSALESVHDALAPGGRFVFDVFVPGFDVICETYGEWETKSTEYRGEAHEVRTRTRMADEVEQRFAVETELYDSSGSLVFAEDDRLSMLPKRQIELLARASPFSDWAVTGDFSDEPIEDGHSIQVWKLVV